MELHTEMKFRLDTENNRDQEIVMFDPFGWRWSELGWHRVPEEQRVITRALELRRECYSLRQVAAIMNDEGCKSRGGKRIHATQIARWERRSRE